MSQQAKNSLQLYRGGNPAIVGNSECQRGKRTERLFQGAEH